MYCIKCGNKIHRGDEFCGNCGAKVEISQVSDTENKSFLKELTSGIFAINIRKICIFAILLVLVIFAFIGVKSLFNKSSDDYDDDEDEILVKTEAEGIFNGVTGSGFSVPTSLQDYLIQQGTFELSTMSARNTAETQYEFMNESSDESVAIFVNGGNSWFDTFENSQMIFGTDGIYVENYYWGNGAYSLTDELSLSLDKSAEGYKRIVSAGTITFSPSMLSTKERYQYIVFKRKENTKIYRMMLIDAVAHQIAYVYDSDLGGADLGYEDTPLFNFLISFDYDTSNPNKISEDLFKIAYNVVLCVDGFVQGNTSAEDALKSLRNLKAIVNDSDFDENERAINRKIDSLIDTFETYINDPSKTVNSSFGYKPKNEIFILRAEMLDALGMQHFDYICPIVK